LIAWATISAALFPADQIGDAFIQQPSPAFVGNAQQPTSGDIR